MKLKLIILVILLVLILIFNVGCQEETLPNHEKLSASELLSRTIEATTKANSYAFEMETEQDLYIADMEGMTIKNLTTGKMINEPLSAKLTMSTSMPGVDMEIDIYLINGISYSSFPGIGWVQQDISANNQWKDSLNDPYAYTTMLEIVENENIDVVQQADHYLLTYDDSDGKLADIVEDNIKKQLANSILDDYFIDQYLKEIDTSRLLYVMKIDKETFLPLENSINVEIEIDLGEDKIYIVQKTNIKYLEFETFEFIEVPEYVINEAVELPDLRS